MAESPKMFPLPYYDQERARWRVVKKFPAAVRADTGTLFTYSWPKGVTPTLEMQHVVLRSYFDRIHAFSVPHDAMLDAHRHRRLQRQIEKQNQVAEFITALEKIDARIEQLNQQTAHMQISQIAAASGITVVVPDPLRPARKPVPVSQALIDLKAHPRHKRGWRNERQEKKFDEAKLRAVNSLLLFAGTEDMADPKIDADLIQAWADSLDDTTTIAHDYVADVKAAYRALGLKRCITDKTRLAEIAAILTPNRPQQKTKRVPFTDPKRVLEDARTREPVVRWLHWCSAFTGLMESEIVEAPAAEIKFVEGRWWWYVGEDRILKTGNRPRVLLIHPALIREGFIEYVATQKGKVLFDVTAEQAVNRVRRHIRKELEITDRAQVFYSHRHAFISALTNNKVELTLRKTLQGHGSQEIDFLHYIHHRQADLIAAIEGIDDPTK